MPTPRKGYYLADGKTRVPGVTTIIGRFKDSGALIHWAWEQGRAGKDFRETRDKAAEAGSLAHAMVEAHLNGWDIEAILLATPEDIQAAGKQGYDNWRTWMAQTRAEVGPWERPLVCEHHQYGGTPDALLRIDGVTALGDWKTGGIYSDHLIQIAAYRHLFEDYDIPIDGGYHLCRFSRDHGDFAHHYYGELDEAWEMFLLLRRAYDLDKVLKKRAK